MITRHGLFGQQVESYAWDEIAQAARVETQDIDGDPVYSLALHLHDGRTVRITKLWLHDPQGLEQNATSIQRFLRQDFKN